MGKIYKGDEHLGDYFSSSREKGVEGLPLLSVTLHNGLIHRGDLDRRTETNIEANGHLLVRQGDIAYNMMRIWQGALGRANFDGIVSPAYVVLRPNKDIDSKFSEYLFNTPRMIYLFWAYSYGLTKDRLRLYFNDFKKIPTEMLPLPEQKKIAKILSTWDRTIEVTENLLNNSQQQKKSLMQQLLTGKKRLPGFSGRFKRCHFSGIAQVDGDSLGKKTSENFEFQYISLSDVTSGTISKELETHVFKNAPSRARRIVKNGDILLATVRPNLQGFAKISRQHESCIASTGFAVLSPKKRFCGDYLYHYLFGAHIKGQINALVVGTNYPAINSSDVRGLLIYCPEHKEQKRVASIFNNCDSTIHALSRKLGYLKQEKKALMQQLLTGKRRVKIDEEVLSKKGAANG